MLYIIIIIYLIIMIDDETLRCALTLLSTQGSVTTSGLPVGQWMFATLVFQTIGFFDSFEPLPP
jgi:hypothetical protein